MTTQREKTIEMIRKRAKGYSDDLEWQQRSANLKNNASVSAAQGVISEYDKYASSQAKKTVQQINAFSGGNLSYSMQGKLYNDTKKALTNQYVQNVKDQLEYQSAYKQHDYTGKSKEEVDKQIEQFQNELANAKTDPQKQATQKMIEDAKNYQYSLMSVDDVRKRESELEKEKETLLNTPLKVPNPYTKDEEYIAQKEAVDKRVTEIDDELGRLGSYVKADAYQREDAQLLSALSEDEAKALENLYISEAFITSEYGNMYSDEWTRQNETYNKAKKLLEAKYGKDGTDRLLEAYEYTKNAEIRTEQKNEINDIVTNANGWGDAGLFLGNMGATGLSTLTAPFENIATIAHGLTNERPIDYNSPIYTFSNLTNDLSEANLKKHEDSFVYQTAHSVANSLTSMLTAAYAGGAIMGNAGSTAQATKKLTESMTLFLMGNSAGANAALDMAQRGGNNEQILGAAIASGIIEVMFEKVSLSYFFGEEKLMQNVATSQTPKKEAIKSFFISMGINASEEVMTDIANTVYDTVVNGDLSQYALEIQQYMDLGYSEKQAKHLWSVDFGEQLAMTAFSSMIMGGLLSGGNYVKAAKNAPYINKTADMLQQAYNMPREDALKIMTNHVLSGESQAETQALINRANEIINNPNAVNNQNTPANTANLFEGLSEQGFTGLNQSNLNNQENIANIPNNEYNNNRGNEYGRTDEFRELEKTSSSMPDEELQSYRRGSKEVSPELRRRLSRVFTEEVGAFVDSHSDSVRVLDLSDGRGNDYKIYENADGALFHDIFNVARNYLVNGELVDIHDIKTTDDGIGYNDCKNYISSDGMSGFSITPDGDLISVFNAGEKRGFLRAISGVVKSSAKTLDCYASPNQDLQKIYSDIFGFKTASVMDYNMEYDHDNIAQNHNSPQVAFMVNTESDVKTRYFNKDSYDEAQAYQRSFFNEDNDNITGSETLSEQGSVNTQENVVANQQAVEDESTNNTVDEATSQVKNSYENPVITENFTDDDATHTKIVKRIDYSQNMDFSEENLNTIHNEYVDSTDDDIVSFYERVNNGEKTKPYQLISEVNEQQVKDIAALTGIDVSGSSNVINRSISEHIEKRHGINGTADKSMSDVADIGRIQYVLDNYDTVELLEGESSFRNADKTNAPLVRFSKRVNGTVYVVEAIADSKSKNIWVNSAYKKETSIKSSDSITTPQLTAEPSVENNASNSNIPNSQPDVKQNNTNDNKNSALVDVDLDKIEQMKPQKQPFGMQITDSNDIIAEDSKETAVERIRQVKEKAKKTINFFGREMSDTGYVIDKATRKKNRDVYTAFHDVKGSMSKLGYAIGTKIGNTGKFSGGLYDIAGNRVDNSVMEILSPFMEADSRLLGGNLSGQELKNAQATYWKEAQEYLICLHNLDCINNGEIRVFSLDKETTAAKIEAYEAAHPEFKTELVDARNRITNFILQYEVDSGRLTQQEADSWQEKYPNYVPTYREQSDTEISHSARQSPGTDARVHATGSNAKIMALDKSLVKKLNETIKYGNRNTFLNRLLNAATENSELAQNIEILKTYKDVNGQSSSELLGNYAKMKDVYVAYTSSGGAVVFKASEDMSVAIQDTISTRFKVEEYLGLWQKTNAAWRGLVTDKNPMFIVSNAVRDFQEALFYSENKFGKNGFVQNYKNAINEIKSNSELWQQFQASGVMGAGIATNDSGRIDLETKSNRIARANEVVEALPRFAEYMRTINELGNTYEGKLQAQYNAKEITTNFSRGGRFARFLNRNGANFFNASIQGASKYVRQFTETISGNGSAAQKTRAVCSTLLKGIIFGATPRLLNELLHGDDDEYEDLDESLKQQYFLINTGIDGVFLRIPYGRANIIGSVVADNLMSIAKGDEVDVAESLKTIYESIGISKPSTLFTPLIEAKNNKAWHGGSIVSSSLLMKPESEQYDENTDEISKYLGKLFNISPKKINYVLDQWSGVVGDFVLPMLTPKYRGQGFIGVITSPFVKRFTTDSVTNNKIADEFYSYKNEIYTKKQADNAEPKYELIYKYLNSQSAETSDIWSDIHNVQNYVNLSSADKMYYEAKYESYGDLSSYKVRMEVVRDMRKLINGIQKNALENTTAVESVAEKTAEKYLSGDYTQSELNYALFEMNKECFGAEYAFNNYYDNVSEKANLANYCGIDYDKYYSYYVATKDLNAKDENGNSVNGLKKKRYKEAINSLELSKGEKVFLYAQSYSVYGDDADTLLKFINSQNLSVEEKTELFEMFDCFEVNGTKVRVK